MRAMKSHDDNIIRSIRERSHLLKEITDLDPLFNKIGDANVVMLGEASHGTHEYYTWRTYISKRLISEKKFSFIAVEGDWPDCYEVNRFVKNYPGTGRTIRDVLQSYDRWPTWMWANWEIAALAEWMKNFNEEQKEGNKIGFYGLDVYSLWESMEAILSYLKKTDPASVDIALEAYKCFEPHKGDEGQGYARSLQFVPNTCEEEVTVLLKQIRERSRHYDTDPENIFNVEQNALITVNAEHYYRSMLRGGSHSWNVRDTHMNETLERLMQLHGPGAKAIVWEHNTHIGDARATDMAQEGMINIGELARNNKNYKVFLTGFGSYEGTVIAGKKWGAKMEEMEVPEARLGSWEYCLHQAGDDDKLLIMDDFNNTYIAKNFLGHRAIGVVYNPVYEKYGNYVRSIIPQRYDAFIYLDKTKALMPFHLHVDSHKMPETYPFGV
jgi:erythromycin esterase